MLTRAEIVKARDRFYPRWWMYDDAEQRGHYLPLYKVMCRTLEEYNLALLVKPRYIRATLVLSSDEHR